MRLQPDMLANKQDENALSAYSLTQLEVYNWGPFSALHRITLHKKGSALIGQTGSGKTTLVDAIMTLICSQPKYNLASTGGHESDRDLMSYVRGVTGMGGDDESIHTARSGKTSTAICLQMSNATEHIRLTALFWIDSSSNSQSDLKRLWIFDKTTQQGLGDYLPQLKELGLSGLKRQLKEQQGVLATDNKKVFLSHCIKFFEVGKNAFVLLNRAAGLKQLNSINDLFRDLVLDNKTFFKSAQGVANGFDELKGIHAELELAKQQQQSLLPIEKHWKKHQNTQQVLTQLQRINQLLPRWFAHSKCQLLSEQQQQLDTDINRQQSDLEQATQQMALQITQVEDSYVQYQQLGGANIEELKRQQQEQQKQLAELQQNVKDYVQLCLNLCLDKDISLHQLKRNQQHCDGLLKELDASIQGIQQQREELTKDTLNAEEAQRRLEQDMQQVRQAPNSNIPYDFIRFQQLLADELGINSAAIPYIGQSIEVQDKAWQGAIERAIGSHRLRLVVADSYIDHALYWLNQRNNKLHIRLLNAADYQQQKTPLDDGFYHKLSFKNDNLHSVVKNFIASIDRHCLASTALLKHSAYGLTEQGMMSGKRGLFEKQDQRALNQGWMTGFDNKNLLNELQQALADCTQQATSYRQQFEAIKQQEQQLNIKKTSMQQLQTVRFEQLNVTGKEAALTTLSQRLAQLQDPNSDAGKAEQRWHTAKQQQDALQGTINQLNVHIQIAQNALEASKKSFNLAHQRLANALSQKEIDLMSEQQKSTRTISLSNIAEAEREANTTLQDTINRKAKMLNDLEVKLGKAMQAAQAIDNGALNEVGSELEDINDYLERLNLLSKEDLPNKIKRFRDYLTLSSDQGVNQLLSSIEAEIARIEERIEALNATLKAVDFQTNRYLQLIPKQVVHESLTTLNKTQKKLISAILIDDEGESHYKALMSIVQLLRDAVERKQTNSAKALLDPRYRLQFYVQIIERETGVVIETRTGSKGGSGGEKEIIASFILTASLSYALCPKNATTPLFSTVILDEAFSKSSQAVAARIISALKEFGLHPLFVTPNKEMRLLREHTHSAILVHRKQQSSSALCLSWQEIDQHLSQR